MIRAVLTVCLILVSAMAGHSSKFEELDKPPEGARKGQMLLGGYFSMGYPQGKVLDAENDFVKDYSYEISDDIYKLLWVSHLSFSYGASYEYMPIDYLGVKARLGRMFLVQRTRFGSEYENWREILYDEYSILVGPSLHATTRKRWDFTLTPFIGYVMADYTPTPIAKKLIADYDAGQPKDVSTYAAGAELNFTGYFSGGLYITFGFDWQVRFLDFGGGFTLEREGLAFFPGGRDSRIYSYSFIFSAGYAFSH